MINISQEQPERSAREVTVHFVPQWPGNPYHASLATNLLGQGVRVEDEDRLKFIWIKCRRSGVKPQIVHIHAIPSFCLALLPLLRSCFFYYRLVALRMSGVKIVWTIHDISHHEAEFPQLENFYSRIVFNIVDFVIVHSEGARKAIESQWRVRSNERLTVIPHGDYISSYPNHGDRILARNKLGVLSTRMVFLFFGYIRPYKGVDELITVFKKLKLNNCELVIAGNPLNDEISERIRLSINGDTRIHYLPGRVKDDELQNIFNAADVVVLPYSKVLTSGALILAMSFGCACIVPKIRIFEEALDADGGIFYDPEEPDGLRHALLSAYRGRSGLQLMGKRNFKKVSGSQWSESARLTADVYRRCLGY